MNEDDFWEEDTERFFKRYCADFGRRQSALQKKEGGWFFLKKRIIEEIPWEEKERRGEREFFRAEEAAVLEAR